MSKLCCDPFKILKKKVTALIRVIKKKVYLQHQSNVSLETGKKDHQSSEKQ